MTNPAQVAEKIRPIISYSDESVKLNAAINGIFHLLIENSFKGIPAKFDLIVCLKTEAEQLVKVGKYMQESGDVTANSVDGVAR